MPIKFSLNQMVMPNDPFENFVLLAKTTGVNAIEIRNDIKTNLIKENEPIKLKEICEANSLKILTVNALQKFNIWNDERSKEFIELCKFASLASIEAIVLVPLNDNSIIEINEQRKLLHHSLKHIETILSDYDVMGFVEPLGFQSSSLRNKSMVKECFQQLNISKIKIVHDTFHHFVAQENFFSPTITGLVHISGVSKKFINEHLQDKHRSFIDPTDDIIDNIQQIKVFIDQNYQGFFSFEPFSEEVIINNPKEKIKKMLKLFSEFL